MTKDDLLKYADYLLEAAILRCDNLADAQDLAQETLLTALTAIEKGRKITSPKAWLSHTLNHKYYDMLRQKYRRPVVYCDVPEDIADDYSLYDSLKQSSDMENIRRELAYLAGIYRETMVRYYMKGQTIEQIASELGVSKSAVKSRLFAGRNNLRKEFDSMENYAKQSYEPEKLYLSSSGGEGINGEPFSLVKDDIRMNLLILAYEKPVTVPELAKAIGIPTAYIEPAIDEMVDGEIMKRMGNKVYTDFIIYSPEDKSRVTEPTRRFLDKNFDGLWTGVSSALEELRTKEYYLRQNVRARQKLELYFAISVMHNGFVDVRDKVLDKPITWEDYPERRAGGKWFCMGNRYPKDFDFDNAEWTKYCISGEYRTRLDNYHGCHSVMSAEYDTCLGQTHSAYSKLHTRESELVKLLYAVHKELDSDLDVLDRKLVEQTDKLCEIGYLARENGRLIVDLPVLTMQEYRDVHDLSSKYEKRVYAPFGSELVEIIRGGRVAIPSHLKSVPDYLRYLHTDDVVMMTLIEAKEKGLFLQGVDHKAPSSLLVIEK